MSQVDNLGRRQGVFKEYLSNGQLWFEFNYKDDVLSGKWKTFDGYNILSNKYDKLSGVSNYNDGIREGEEFEYEFN